jgi:hypothetical protein
LRPDRLCLLLELPPDWLRRLLELPDLLLRLRDRLPLSDLLEADLRLRPERLRLDWLPLRCPRLDSPRADRWLRELPELRAPRVLPLVVRACRRCPRCELLLSGVTSISISSTSISSMSSSSVSKSSDISAEVSWSRALDFELFDLREELRPFPLDRPPLRSSAVSRLTSLLKLLCWPRAVSS